MMQHVAQTPYLLAVRGHVQPGKAAEFAQIWKDFIGARATQMPELQHAYYVADQATHSTLAVFVWSAKPDEAQWGRVMQDFEPQIRDLGAGSASVEWYEVLQQI